jgi:CRP-like cAMP-binding protein
MERIKRGRLLGTTQLFSSLGEPYLEELAVASRVQRLKRGETLFLEGQQADKLYVIASGSIRAFCVSSKGREQTIHVERTGATLAKFPSLKMVLILSLL